jgi:hypothetical protein
MSVWVGSGSAGPNLEPRLIVLEDTEYVYEVWKSIASGTSGTVAAYTGATILLDRYLGAADALIVEIKGGVPTDEPVVTSAGVLVTTTFDVSGNYTLSGTPSAYPVALVYQIKVPAKYASSVPVADILSKTEQLPMFYGTGSPPTATGMTEGSIYFKYTP